MLSIFQTDLIDIALRSEIWIEVSIFEAPKEPQMNLFLFMYWNKLWSLLYPYVQIVVAICLIEAAIKLAVHHNQFLLQCVSQQTPPKNVNQNNPTICMAGVFLWPVSLPDFCFSDGYCFIVYPKTVNLTIWKIWSLGKKACPAVPFGPLNCQNLALSWPKHGPHMVLLIGSSWILIVVSRDATYQMSESKH